EEGDAAVNGGNFALLERLIRGSGSEELRIPIYTVFGNHDYRVNPYELLARVDLPDIPFVDDRTVSEHGTHNLTPDDARSLQNGKVVTLSPDGALRMLAVDPNNQSGKYDYYLRRIND